MFNLGKMLRYAGRILLFVTLIIFLTVILSVLTEASEIGDKSLLDLIGEVLYVLLVITLPLFAAVVGAFLVAGAFVKAVYKLDGFGAGIKFIMHQRFGRPGFKPFLILDQGKITMGADGPLPQRGGPGALIIRNNTAVVTDKRGKLTRVEGVGFPALEPFEMIYDIIDLRPKRWVYSVGAMTKDGISITWPVEIRYQIDDGGQESTPDAPFPFSAEAVFKASTGKWRREVSRKQDMDWEGWVVVSQTEGTFRSMLARRKLDELIGLTEAESLGVREILQQELEEAISAVAPKVGAKILGIKLQNLIVEDDVTQQWIEAWQAGWQVWSTKNLASFEAERIKEYETAKVDAQILPLNKLTDELQKLDTDADQAILIARLASVIDRGHADVASRIFFPGQALESISNVHRVLREGDSGTRRNSIPASSTPLPPPDSDIMDDIEWRSGLLLNVPVVAEIPAGPEQPTTDNVIATIKRIGETNFELEQEANQTVLKAYPLNSTKLTFPEGDNFVAVKITSDSMNGANILPNDYVILKQTNVPKNRDIVALVFEDEADNKATLKRFSREYDKTGKLVRIIISPSNPKYKVRSFSVNSFTKDKSPLRIVGVALAVLKVE